MKTIRACVACGNELKENKFLDQELEYCNDPDCPRYGFWTQVSRPMYWCFDCDNYHDGYDGECPLTSKFDEEG